MKSSIEYGRLWARIISQQCFIANLALIHEERVALRHLTGDDQNDIEVRFRKNILAINKVSLICAFDVAKQLINTVIGLRNCYTELPNKCWVYDWR